MPNDEVSLAKLQTFLTSSKRLFLFAGAGVSMRAGLPSWEALLKKLAESIRSSDALSANLITQLCADKKFEAAASAYFNSEYITEQKKYSAIQELLSQFDAAPLVPLMKLPFQSAITTNFDKVLNDATAMARQIAPIDFYRGSGHLTSACFERNFFIARIHGRIENPETIVLGKEAFKTVAEDSQYVDILKFVFTRTQLLFVGFSFWDPAIQKVLKTTNKLFGPMTEGAHLALLPENAAGEMVSILNRLNIDVIRYSSDNNHAALWKLIEDASTQLSTPTGASPQPTDFDPLASTRSFLAATYARSAVAPNFESLKLVTLEGIVLSLIQSAGQGGISAQSLGHSLAKHLAQSEKEVSPIVGGAIKALLEAKLVRKQKLDQGERYFSVGSSTDSPLQSAIGELSQAVINRLAVTHGILATREMRDCICGAIEEIILERGWDLGASFIRRIPAPAATIEPHIRNHGLFVSGKVIEAISLAMQSLFDRPSAREAELLTSLGRISFAVCLLTAAPKTALTQALILPQRLYLDASILLPAIVPGHPHHKIYRQAIAKLVSAAKGARLSVEVVAYWGFLNEVVSHKRLAKFEAAQLNEDFKAIARREAVFYGTQNQNVYVGAYMNALNGGSTESFEAFLANVAPYENEGELAKYTESLGIHVFKRLVLEGPKFAQISLELQKAYAGDLAKQKTAMLIEHDAVQLSALDHDQEKSVRSIWVTADRRLRQKLELGKYSSLTGKMLDGVGLAQLVDLLTGLNPNSTSFAALLWSVEASDASEQIKNYLISIALEKYDEGIAMALPALLDKTVESIEVEARRQGVTLDPKAEGERGALLNLVGSFENSFFEAMAETIAKRKREESGGKD